MIPASRIHQSCPKSDGRDSNILILLRRNFFHWGVYRYLPSEVRNNGKKNRGGGNVVSYGRYERRTTDLRKNVR